MMIADRLFAECRSKGLDLPENGLRHCLVSSNRGANGNDLLFVFRSGQSYPCLVAKIARTAENNRGLGNEYRWARMLKKRQLGLGLVPETFFSGELNGHTYFVQQTVAGLGLGELLRTQNPQSDPLAEILQQALAFLADLHGGRGRLTQGQKKSPASRLRGHLQTLDCTPLQARRIEAAAAAVGLESCFCHGDFWATNLLVDTKSNRLAAVIDYEFASDACYTFFDIVWFVANLPLFVEDGPAAGMTDRYRRAFFRQSGNLSLYRQLLSSYFELIGRPVPPLVDLFILALVYGSFREQQLFGKALTVDMCCQDLLFYTIEHETGFSL